MKKTASFLFCLCLAACARVLFADAGFESFERSVYCDQQIQALVNQVNRDCFSGNGLNSDPLASAVSKFQEEVYQGGMQQPAPKNATPPHVFEFSLQNLSGENLRMLLFLPRGGSDPMWSFNAIADEGATAFLNSSLSLDFRGTKEPASKFPTFESVSVMAHNMNGQPVHNHYHYVSVPTGVSCCTGMLMKIIFADDVACYYDIKQSKATIRIYKNRAELYTGTDRYGNACYEDVPQY